VGVRSHYLAAAAALAFNCSVVANAQTEQRYRFDIPSQQLKYALRAVTREAGLQLLASADDLRGLRSNELHADATVDEALQRLLVGTNLQAEIRGKAVFVRGRSSPPRPQAVGTAVESTDIVVTGSHIRGGEPNSEVIVSSRETIERAGQTNLGDFARTIPQNFGGGQAPGIVNVQGGSENVGSGSNLNLRGLGPDATLTLVNGHRVAYDAAFQGVDISAIPLAAVDRIEIVPDGASALYGSDAVGGVANVILRRDYDGLSTSARVGAATDGGDQQQEYNGVVGKRWTTGGLMGTIDYSRSTAIAARDRSYTSALDGSETLLPKIKQLSAVITGHQALGEHIELDLDGQYNDRNTSIRMPFTSSGNYLTSGSLSFPKVRSYSITPSLRVDLSSGWRLAVTGTFADSRTDIPSVQYSDLIQILAIAGSYKDRTENLEASAEGALFTLPGGEVRLAVGGGYRTTRLDTLARLTAGGQTSTLVDFDSSRRIAYGYGELSVPVVGDGNRIPFIDKLLLTGAVRYEDYRHVADVASPKFGLVYKPGRDVSIRASWGKSFKAPTLYQEGQVFEATLFQASDFGVPGARPGQTGLELVGGNPNLKPEKATTWTTTLGYEPRFAPGFKAEATYFHIDYRNRIVSPLASISGAYSDPSFQSLITPNPTPAQLAAIIGRAPLGLENYSDQTYVPANVVLIVDDSLQNSARQAIHGIDLSADYLLTLGPIGRIDASASATYLKSDEKLTPDAKAFPLAGTIFNPPHWRARTGASWDHGSFGLSAFLNYAGGVQDNRFAPVARVRSFTTFDLIARASTGKDSGWWRNIGVSLSALNLLNEKPGFARTTAPNSPSYDATNYSATGRLISLTITKQW
jgi:outer membrane receptor protein involved in Fe transport